MRRHPTPATGSRAAQIADGGTRHEGSAGFLVPRSALGRLAACAVLLGLGVLVRAESLGPTQTLPSTPSNPEAAPRPVSRRDWSLRQTPVVEVIRRVRGAVVNIHSERTAQGMRTDDLFNLTPSQSRVNGMGTGVLIDPRGYIITNQHVVEDVHTLRVRLPDGSASPARILARDTESDLALLKIEPRGPLPIMPLGTSSDLMVGETVIAVGNAYGYENSVTVGVVSAVSRDVTLNREVSYKALIQTDASINPGNSGGPLLNVYGELIGLNVAIRAGAQGIGFAIPVDSVIRVAGGLLAQTASGLPPTTRRGARNEGHPLGARAATGLTVRDEVLRKAREPGATGPAADDGPPRRLVVDGVEPDSPALRAGLKVGDVLLQVGDIPCVCSVDFERALLDEAGTLRGGERMPFRVWRDGGERRVDVALESRERTTIRAEVPAATDRPATGAVGAPADVVWRRLGMRLLAIGADGVAHTSPQLHGGLLITDVREGGQAERAGVQRNDILVGLHQWEMLTLDNVLFVLNHPELPTFQPLRFYILRGGQVHRGHLPVD
jgi:serine protease Do